MRRDSEYAGLEAFLCTFWALYKIGTSLHQIADALKRKGLRRVAGIGTRHQCGTCWHGRKVGAGAKRLSTL